MKNRGPLVMVSFLAAGLLLASVLLAFGHSGGKAAQPSPSNTNTISTTAGRAQTVTVQVSITDHGFNPDDLSIFDGTTVVWTNNREKEVHLVGGLPGQIFLPLVVSDNDGRATNLKRSPEKAVLGWNDVTLAPGQSYSYTFPTAGVFHYHIEGEGWLGRIVVRFRNDSAPAVSWATSPSAVLLRWRWSGRCSGPATFNLYRNGAALAAGITRITNPHQVTTTLGSDWDWITSQYTDVTTVGEFFNKLDGNSLLADQLANARYRVALVLGWGYLDETASSGTPYVYDVRQIVNSQEQYLGAAEMLAGQITPLTAPTNLSVVQTISPSLRTSPDWIEAQQNRKSDRKIYLRWDLPTSTAEEWPANWSASYDIFRATSPSGPYARINIQDGEDRPVIPAPAYSPTSPLGVQDPLYQEYDHYFVDEDPTLQYTMTYYYRVAPRDLLDQPRQWPTHQSQFSNMVSAVPQDTLPPLVPKDLAGASLTTTIVLTWTPQLTDTAGYWLYKSTNITASVLTETCTSAMMDECWTKIVEVGSPSTGIYTDTNVDIDTVYWYRIRAIDDATNLSAWSDPVRGVVHDSTGPCAPQVQEEAGLIIVSPCPQAPDTALFSLFCRFANGPELLLQEISTETLPAVINLQDYYTPAAPVDVICRLQAVDTHGNLGDSSTTLTQTLCPSQPITPTQPIIQDINTLEIAENSFAAEINWEAKDSPDLIGFEIYRQLYGPNPVEFVAAEGPDVRSFLDTGVKSHYVYSYTVTAVRGADACGNPQLKVRSKPKFYKVIPPLDCCSRPTIEVLWDETSSDFAPGAGATLVWHNPRPEAEAMYVVIYRSMRPDRDFVAITPPLYTVAPVYIDTDAEHGNYWYMVLMLNWWTGEVIGASEAWSDSGGGAALALELPSAMPPLSLRESQDILPRAVLEDGYVQITSTADAYINEMSPDENFGFSDQMMIAHSPEVISSTRRALVQFDLSVIPNGSTIDHATFSAYLTDAVSNSVNIDLKRIDSYWDEPSVTWDSQPVASGAVYDTISVGAAHDWYTWTVTGLMHEWWELVSPNHGLMLLGPNDDFSRSFSTKESSDPPLLSVYYFPPPENLFFGVHGDNPFELQVHEYYPGSHQHNLNGIGTLVLGGGPVEPVSYTIEFANIATDPSGIVLTGAITVPLTSPIEIAYPGGFEYKIPSLTIDQDTGRGQVNLALPDHLVAHFWGIPWNAPVILDPATIRQDLTFGVPVDWWGTQDCSMDPPDFAFEMNPLPLQIVPTGPVTFTHNVIHVGDACTQYDERYAGARPGYPDPDANDGYLRPNYNSIRPSFIHADGLAGGFTTAEPVSYTTAVPYGFEIKASGGITLEIIGGRINDGAMHGVELGIWYYDTLITQTIPFNAATVPPPTRYFSSTAEVLYIGQGGYLVGSMLALNIDSHPEPPFYEPLPVSWAGGGFVLREAYYQLYLPPIRSQELPWQDVAANWEGDSLVQAGLNHVTPPGESADFTWYHCSTDKEIHFPDGVQTDLYLRRGGVSDQVLATIPVTNPVHTTLHGYTVTLKTFRVSFCDNSIHDQDLSGDFALPWPADVIIPTYDMDINPNTACVESAKVHDDADPLLLAYWQVNLHPKAIAFRPEPGLSPPPADWDALLWLLGSADVPHLAPPGSSDIAAIPLETSFEPNGNFYRSRLIYKQAHYAFDGFDLLLSKVRLSDWDTSSPERPTWVQNAALENPPACCDPLPTDPNPRGFVELQGNLIVPYFNTLAGSTANSRPDIQVLAWDDYVGFTERPQASRTWKLIGSKLEFEYDLTYAHHHTNHTGILVGFDEHDMEVFKMDSAAVISPTSAGIYLGMSSGTAVLRALAETTIMTLTSSLEPALSNTMTNQWLTRFYNMSSDYVTLLGLIWNSSYTFRETTTRIENLGTDNIPSDPVGGETTSWLASPTGVIVEQLRGDVEFKPVKNGNAVVDHRFERLRVALKLEVDPADVKEILKAKRLALEINRQGDFLLSGKRVVIDLYKYQVDADLALNVNTKKKRMEGGLKLYDFEISGIKFKYIGGVLGVGTDLYYTGGMGEAKFQWGKVGGGFLFGRLDPSSQVLKQMGFGNLLKTLGSSGQSGTWVGAYTRVYGDFPLYNYGCMFKVNVGGDIALWYFVPISPATSGSYGGRMRGYIYGKLLCLVSGRGDLTMELSVPGHGGQGYQWSGNFWMAGGIGFCDPEDWTTWEDKWWGDSWCWTCGAKVDADYNQSKANAWTWDYDDACE